MALIDVFRLTFAYQGGADYLFKDVSFQLDTSWKLGFIGRNGRGKTTLLHLLQGWYEYAGKITSPVDFTYFPFAAPAQPQAAGEVALSIAREAELWQVQRELSMLGVEEAALARPFYTLSNGEQAKILLAAMFLNNNSFLLIDEPTNHLDLAGRAVLSRYLNGKQGFIVVSHDRAFLDGCVDHIISLNKTNIEIQQGNFSSWYINKQREDNYERTENERLNKDISRLRQAARQTAGWSERVEGSKRGTKNSGSRIDRGYVGRKSANMMKRSKAIEARREQAAGERAGLLKNIESAPPLQLHPLRWHTDKLAELRGVSLRYGPNIVCSQVGFTVERGERIALCGKNGSGKSSLLKLLYGEPIAYAGEFYRAARLVVSYLPQDCSFLAGSLADFIAAQGLDQTLFKSTLRQLGCSRELFGQALQYYSEGEKKKVLLAKSLCEQAHLYLWDEPLNYLDVFSRIQLEQLLLAAGATVVFVEHDAAFVQTVATKKLEV